jgi:hypothetical protein
MRTKTLLVTAALSVAAATSWAQVYSVNAVGYVNLTLPSSPTAPPTKGAIIANPLNGTNNNLNTILPLPDAYDSSVIYRFDPVAQTYGDPVSFIAGFGWYNPGDPAGTPPDINPGEGFWLFAVGPNPLTVTFVGEVPQGTLVNPLPAANKLSMRSSIVPQAAPLGDEITAGTLGFAAEDTDTVYVFNSTTQTYKDPYGYIDGYGWFSANADDPGPGGPTIAVATGFFLQKAPLAVKTTWTRTFSVN